MKKGNGHYLCRRPSRSGRISLLVLRGHKIVRQSSLALRSFSVTASRGFFFGWVVVGCHSWSSVIHRGRLGWTPYYGDILPLQVTHNKLHLGPGSIRRIELLTHRYYPCEGQDLYCGSCRCIPFINPIAYASIKKESYPSRHNAIKESRVNVGWLRPAQKREMLGERIFPHVI